MRTLLKMLWLSQALSTEQPSDSANYHDTTEGTGDQEINVIGISNPTQTHVDGWLYK